MLGLNDRKALIPMIRYKELTQVERKKRSSMNTKSHISVPVAGTGRGAKKKRDRESQEREIWDKIVVCLSSPDA